ncbi:hypothetical protein IV203_036812 [Nitzschia inconspicua]|uniref:Uncharacterized protein n=1 Tax=Nitzschia inconspicua TaxID=303405 RepID=A0A9K3LIS1_9STRA|nr:hypothetical protein IV203_036812 [Nitzschia inconspicua]
MLVQLSPWETSRTSLRIRRTSSEHDTNNNRRRNVKGPTVENVGRNSGALMMSPVPAVAASFVNTVNKRGLPKMAAHSTEFNGCLPLLAITTDHQISVVGRKILDRRDYNNVVGDQAAITSTVSSSSSSYREFSSLRYSSRPGDASSFLPKSNARDNNDLPNIAAILDTKNELVYAVQYDNRRLCCWDLWEGSGPDDKIALKVDLISPALSMSLLHFNKGMIYGTCQNGDVFVAKVLVSATTDGVAATKRQLEVDYLPSQRPDGAIHIGTCAEIRATNKTRQSGRKRKMSDSEGNTSVTFHQAFYNSSTIQLVRHDTFVALATAEVGLKTDELVQKIATVVDVGSGQTRDKRLLANADLLISASSTVPSVVLAYTIVDGNRSTTNEPDCGPEQHPDGAKFCASLCLAEATFASHLIRIDSDTKPFGLLSENLIACASVSSVSLFDLKSGALILKKARNRPIAGMDLPLLFKCDLKTATIAALHAHDKQENLLSVTATSVGDAGMQHRLTSLTSSAILTGSLLAPTPMSKVRKFDATERKRQAPGETMEDTVENALAALWACREKHCKGNTSPKSFQEVFEECVSNLTKTNRAVRTTKCGESHLLREENPQHNPQDPSNSFCEDSGAVNALSKMNGGTVVSRVNGKSNKNKSRYQGVPDSLPQTFIDETARLMLDFILAPKQDCAALGLEARLILKGLLRTGRVSARLHFEGSFPLQETTKKHPLYIILRKIHRPVEGNPLTAMQLIVELLQNCGDLSERQLVIMMDYMLRIPQADDIAQTFAESTVIEMTQKLRRDSRSYMSIRGKKINGNQHTNISKEAWLAIGRRLVLAGAELVFHMILCYSECNGIMLRIALAEILHSSAEAIVMAQLLSRMLKSSPSNTPLMHRKNPNFVRTTCQWITSLCESFEDDLKETKTPFGTDYLTHLLNGVQAATRNSQAIISFKDGIGIAESAKKELLHRSDANGNETSLWQPEEELPGYSIDRFVF